jgi:hypothetical protein
MKLHFVKGKWSTKMYITTLCPPKCLQCIMGHKLKREIFCGCWISSWCLSQIGQQISPSTAYFEDRVSKCTIMLNYQFRIINIQCDLLYMVQYDSVDFCRMHASSYIYDPDAFTETVSWSSAVCICGCKSIVYILTGL